MPVPSRSRAKNQPTEPIRKRISPRPFDPDAAAMGKSGIYGLPYSVAESRVVVIPVPIEITTSYGGGTSGAPRAILEASKQVDLADRDTGRPWEAGIAMMPIPANLVAINRAAKKLAAPIIAAGGQIDGKPRLAAALRKVNEAGNQVNDWVYRTTSELLAQDKLPVVVGGDHSAPFGAIRAISQRHPGVGILHIDAHADLREAYEGFTWSHASIFHNVMTRLSGVGRLVQVGLRDVGAAEAKMIENSGGRIVSYFDSDVARRLQHGETFAAIAAEIVSALPAEVYLSWDIDGLDPILGPHTGTPVPGGLSWSEAVGLLRIVAESGRRIVGLDLCEVAPGPKGDEWDANVGARLLYKMIGFALASAGGGTRR